MTVEYLFSGPKGDTPVSPAHLAQPFKITPSEQHPVLTLGDYFDAIRAFLRTEKMNSLIATRRTRLDNHIVLDRTVKLVIRSEKHGVLYHVASVEIVTGRRRSLKFAVYTAVSDQARRSLQHEYDLLTTLKKSSLSAFLPRPYLESEMGWEAGSRTQPLFMVLAEWLEGYNEWHLSVDQKSRSQRVCIWDQRKGHHFASKQESFEIYKHASKILTLFYNPKNFHQVCPWHHAAGDFVVKINNGKVDLRLTTVRGYEPVLAVPRKGRFNRFIAIVNFFLNMTIKMRLDKLDGMGKTAWADLSSLQATVEGFFEALKIKKTEGTYPLGSVEDLLCLLKSFNQPELHELFQPWFKLYEEEDPEDLSWINANLERHTRELRQVIQRFRL